MTARQAQPEGPRRLRDTARRKGLGAALTALHRQAGPATLVFGPAGHTLAPADLAATATRACHSGRLADRDPAQERELTTSLLATLGLSALHAPPGLITTPASAPDRSWELATLWVRLGLTQGLLETVLDYLRTRRSGETPLLQQQLVKGQIAASTVRLLEVSSGLAAHEGHSPEDAALRYLHESITFVDQGLTKLLGAFGFTADGPGAGAYVSELLSDVYGPSLLTDAST